MSACRQRKGFSSITSKLSRILGHVTRKRKAFAVQHAFLHSPLATPPSSAAFTALFPFFPSHTPKIPHFASHIPSRQHSSYLTPCSSPLRIHNAPRSAFPSLQRILHIDPHILKKDLHTHPSPPWHSNTSPLSESVAPGRCRGEHSVHDTLWAVTLLALLCIFLCIGKEIAFVVVTAAHLILQIALTLGLNGNYAARTSSHHHDNSVEKEDILGSNGHMHSLNRSSTIPHRSEPTFATSNRRSKSWTTLHSSVEGQMQPSKDIVDSTSSERATISSPRRGKLSAELKLQVMLLFTLGGLYHGRFLAMCMALCCILIYSKMERFFCKRRL